MIAVIFVYVYKNRLKVIVPVLFPVNYVIPIEDDIPDDNLLQ